MNEIFEPLTNRNNLFEKTANQDCKLIVSKKIKYVKWLWWNGEQKYTPLYTHI